MISSGFGSIPIKISAEISDEKRPDTLGEDASFFVLIISSKAASKSDVPLSFGSLLLVADFARRRLERMRAAITGHESSLRNAQIDFELGKLENTKLENSITITHTRWRELKSLSFTYNESPDRTTHAYASTRT